MFIDTLLNCRWVIPVVPQNFVLERVSIAIHNKRIIAICEQSEASQRFEPSVTYALDRHLVLPGLINSHTYASLNVLAKIIFEQSNQSWFGTLPQVLAEYPVSPQLIGDATQIAVAEMIKTGTTCFADVALFSNIAANVARECGIRSQISFPLTESSKLVGKSWEAQINVGLRLFDEYKNSEHIRVACAPQSISSLDNNKLTDLATYVHEIELPLQICERNWLEEISISARKFKARPLERLAACGLLTPQSQLIHMTQLKQRDLLILQEFNSHIVYCPRFNLISGSEFCPVGELKKMNINVAIGSGGFSRDLSFDLLNDLQFASFLSRALDEDDGALSPLQSLRMATLDGAKALGWQEEIGTLEINKLADLIAIEIKYSDEQTINNIAAGVVYKSYNHKITHSFVGGLPLMINGNLETLNEELLHRKRKDWVTKMVQVNC